MKKLNLKSLIVKVCLASITLSGIAQAQVSDQAARARCEQERTRLVNRFSDQLLLQAQGDMTRISAQGDALLNTTYNTFTRDPVVSQALANYRALPLPQNEVTELANGARFDGRIFELNRPFYTAQESVRREFSRVQFDIALATRVSEYLQRNAGVLSNPNIWSAAPIIAEHSISPFQARINELSAPRVYISQRPMSPSARYDRTHTLRVDTSLIRALTLNGQTVTANLRHSSERSLYDGMHLGQNFTISQVNGRELSEFVIPFLPASLGCDRIYNAERGVQGPPGMSGESGPSGDIGPFSDGGGSSNGIENRGDDGGSSNGIQGRSAQISSKTSATAE